MTMTNRQAEIYAYLRDFVAERGFPPSLREICAHCGFASTNAAADHLKALQRKRLIRIHGGKARGIQVLRLTGNDHGKTKEADQENEGPEGEGGTQASTAKASAGD